MKQPKKGMLKGSTHMALDDLVSQETSVALATSTKERQWECMKMNFYLLISSTNISISTPNLWQPSLAHRRPTYTFQTQEDKASSHFLHHTTKPFCQSTCLMKAHESSLTAIKEARHQHIQATKQELSLWSLFRYIITRKRWDQQEQARLYIQYATLPHRRRLRRVFNGAHTTQRLTYVHSLILRGTGVRRRDAFPTISSIGHARSASLHNWFGLSSPFGKRWRLGPTFHSEEGFRWCHDPLWTRVGADGAGCEANGSVAQLPRPKKNRTHRRKRAIFGIRVAFTCTAKGSYRFGPRYSPQHAQPLVWNFVFVAGLGSVQDAVRSTSFKLISCFT